MVLKGTNDICLEIWIHVINTWSEVLGIIEFCQSSLVFSKDEMAMGTKKRKEKNSPSQKNTIFHVFVRLPDLNLPLCVI